MRIALGALVAAAMVLPLLPAAADAAPARHPLEWRSVDVGTDQGLRGLAPVSSSTAWVGGSDGGVWRTTDGGATWADVAPPATDGLQFRDVEATDARHAQVLAIGEADASRIYKTSDGGATWRLTFVNDDPAAFYDCFSFWPGGRYGLAMSDPVEGRFRILATSDFGESWSVLPSAGMPEAPGEFGFAASGTCLVTAGGTDAYLASGGDHARVYHSHDRGRTWSVADSTLPSSSETGAGAFSLAFKTPAHGLVVGGDLGDETNGADFAATTRDWGATWQNAGDLGGYRSGVTWAGPHTAIAVGPTGSDVSYDDGRTWSTFSATGYDAVFATPDGTVWASGSGGRVARLSLH